MLRFRSVQIPGDQRQGRARRYVHPVSSHASSYQASQRFHARCSVPSRAFRGAQCRSMPSIRRRVIAVGQGMRGWSDHTSAGSGARSKEWPELEMAVSGPGFCIWRRSSCRCRAHCLARPRRKLPPRLRTATSSSRYDPYSTVSMTYAPGRAVYWGGCNLPWSRSEACIVGLSSRQAVDLIGRSAVMSHDSATSGLRPTGATSRK